MSLLIKGVQVVDGTGKPPYKADVLVQRNIISAIGNLGRRRARREIDGLGNYLVPGFIDVHTTTDHYLSLFTDPGEENFAQSGVTTAIAGHCGASLAPLLYGSLESIRKWTDPEEINVNWQNVREFLKTLDRLPLAVNFGTLAGHSTIRRALIGEEKRRLTVGELIVFENVLKQALKDGAFGLSTGLGYVHAYPTTTKEIKPLIKLAAVSGGVYSTHLRGEPRELLEAVKETVKISKETGVKTIISHLAPLKNYGNEFDQALELLEKNAHRASVHFDISPELERHQTLYTLLPQSLKRKNLETMLETVGDPRIVSLIKKEWQKLDLTGIRIVNAPGHPYLAGRLIQDADDLLQLMTAVSLRATITNPDVDEARLKAALNSKLAFIGSSSVAPHGIFAKYLEGAIAGGAPIEQAVRKITSGPAVYFNLKQRGLIKERQIADLVIIGKNDYKVRHTVLGGRIAADENFKGEVLRHRP